jgi:ATP-dependent Lhr-like helicase
MTLTKNGFHPIIREWFSETYGSPTDVQKKAWPEIASGNHLLITAPTGSGKTLAAFLWAIHRLLSNDWPPGQTRVVYISPLKALNNDVERNLIKPLEQLKARFQAKGEPFPDIRVATRSGDTPAGERRKMLRTPPEILITTPESLNILVSSKGSRKILERLAVVILDEVHAVAGGKRGVHLMTAVDRLVPLSGEFQRIALSATVKPMDRIAEFIGGYRMQGDVHEAVYQKRPVTLIRSHMQKEMTVRVGFPANAREKMVDDSWWPALIESFKEIIHENRSTLFFTNSRRMAEKVARLINEGEPEELAYSHHGSLSKELRLVVEQKLKNGELKAIVATNSLELGIDIGDLDQVVLIQTPPAISSAIQRIGRSGHGVGEKSRGYCFPFTVAISSMPQFWRLPL